MQDIFRLLYPAHYVLYSYTNILKLLLSTGKILAQIYLDICKEFVRRGAFKWAKKYQ